MGSPPPEDAPEPSAQDAATAEATFEAAPSGATLLCGFPIPGFTFNLNFKIPGFDFAFPPTFFFALSLKCDLSDPIDADFGGGRVGDEGLDADPEFG